MKKALLKALRRVVGAQRFSTDPVHLRCFSYDNSRHSGIPAAVVLPETTEEVSSIVSLCHQEGVPVFPRGAGTGTVGGAIPDGGVVVSLTKMARVSPPSRSDLVVQVGPGAVTGEVQAIVESSGLFYPPDPASLAVCTIGGNVATCAGGPRGVKYGVTRDYVRRVEMVMADGEVVQLGHRTIKGVAGYDLVSLLVGSEGTLGIFTSIWLKLLPLPETRKAAAIYFKEKEGAIGLVPEIFAKGILPCCAEFVDHRCLGLLRDKELNIPAEAASLLIVECDGPRKSVEDEIMEIGEIAGSAGALSVEVAGPGPEYHRLWNARRMLSPTLREAGYSGKINEDVCVPVSRLSDMLGRIGAIEEAAGLFIPTFGHAGDGNLHVNVLFQEEDPEQAEQAEEAAEAIMREAVALDGTISGEHGIGLSKKRFLPFELGRREMEITRDVKRMMDPKNILNPHKVVDLERGAR